MTPLSTAQAGPPHGQRVLLVVDAVVGGGAEQHVVDLALGLHERGWDVTIACSCAGSGGPDGGHVVTSLRDRRVPVHDLLGYLAKRRLCLPYAARLRGLVHRGRFDVVHAHIYASEVAAALALIGSPVPLVVSEHTEAPWRRRPAQLGSRLVYRRAALIIAVSHAISAKLRAEYRVPRHRVRVILPVGRTVSTSAASGAGRSTDLPGGPLVGFVGRLQPEKGVDVLLHAMVRVLDSQPQTRLVVVGTGPERLRLEELARRLGIAEAVCFLGARPGAAALMSGFDVLAVPSRSDGTPLVVHEAMSAGIAVVGSATGGIVDRLHHGRTGVLVPPADPAPLAGAIVGLLSNDEERRRIAQAAQRAAAATSYQQMLDAVEQVYVTALGGGVVRPEAAGTTRYRESADVTTLR